jgi:integrase
MASIEKRGKSSYRIVVSAGYDSSGKKIRASKKVKLEPGLSPAKTKKELKRQAALFEEKVRKGTYLDGKITLKDFSEVWLRDHAEKQLAPKTVNSYRKLLDNRIIPALGHIKLDKLQPVQLIEFYDNLAEKGIPQNKRYIAKPELIKAISESGSRKGYTAFAQSAGINDRTVASICKGGKTIRQIAEKIASYMGKKVSNLFLTVEDKKKLSSNTISHYHRLISSMLSCAVQWQIIKESPADRVKPPKVQKKDPKYYDEQEVIHMLELLEDEPIRLKAIVYLVIFLGMRLGELSGLEWKDIDMDSKTINIRRESQYIDDKSKLKHERINTKCPKNATSIRAIAVSPIVLKVLKQYKTWQNKEKLKLGELWQEHDRLFTQWNGSPIFPDTPSKLFQEFRERNNLPPLTFHQLRHTNASLMIAQGVDVTTVGKRLGHSTPSTTMKVYAHALKRPDKEAAAKLDSLFSDIKSK